MKSKIVALLALVSLSACGLEGADFKYTESSKITGGAMAGMMRFAGVLSKKAREPMGSTVYVKGNRMRRDDGEGRAEIIDLDGRRIISIDPQKRTYSVMTFDQMRQAIEQAKAKAEAEEKKQAKNPNVKITPKFSVEPGTGNKVILGQNTHEVKVNVGMEMQSDDPQAKGQTATFSMNSDEYIAPSVPGYQEMLNFSMKMAKELDWVPGAVFGGNSQMSSAMVEAAKNADQLKGFPLLQYSSFGGAGTGMNAGSTPPPSRGQSQPQSQSPSINPLGMTPAGMAVKTLGGMLGHRKKKNSDDQSAENQSSGQPSQAAQAPPGNPGALMEMTTEVTSYSNSALDPSLFEIPSGYQQIEADPNRAIR